MGSLKKSKMEQEKSNTSSTRDSNVSKKYSKTSLISKTVSKTSLITKTSKSAKEHSRESKQLDNSVSRQESSVNGQNSAPSRDSKAIKMEKLAFKMESILEDLPPDRHVDPKRKTIIDTIQTEIAAQKGVKAFNKQIGKIKREGQITAQPKSSKLERMTKNNTDPPEQHEHYIYSVDEAATASMGTRKATESFSMTSKMKLTEKNKFSIAEIPPFSPIKESGVRENLSTLNKSIMEEWKSQSEPEPDFRDNSNLLGKSPKKKKKKSSKKSARNESDVWSDNNNPERVPESVIHENLNTLN